MTLPLLSVMFPNWNGGDEPLVLLASLDRSGYPADRLDIVMVDNGSTDGSASRVAAAHPTVRIIRNLTNRGFAAAVNQAIAASRGTLLFITNDDVTVAPGSLTALVEYLDAHPDVGVVGGRVVAKDDPTQTLFAGKTFSFWTGLQRPNPRPDRARDVDFIEGAALLTRRSVVERIGGFDERFAPAYWEDVDFCLRVRRAGLRVRYAPAATFTHRRSASLRQLPLTDVFRIGLVNRYRFYRKHATLLQWASFLAFHVLVSIPFRNLVKRDQSLPAEWRAFRWLFGGERSARL